jgi:hypothetical protein
MMEIPSDKVHCTYPVLCPFCAEVDNGHDGDGESDDEVVTRVQCTLFAPGEWIFYGALRRDDCLSSYPNGATITITPK